MSVRLFAKIFVCDGCGAEDENPLGHPSVRPEGWESLEVRLPDGRALNADACGSCIAAPLGQFLAALKGGRDEV